MLFQEHKATRRRTTPAIRRALVTLALFLDWQHALVVVKPETFITWHRTAFRIFWRWKSQSPGRPPLPKNLRQLIREMDRDNPSWGEERIANELFLKLGMRVSPRTVRKYLDVDRPGGKTTGLRWSTFLGNHAKVIVACDFFVVAMEIGSRRILHHNVTQHPTAEWTMQQFREFLAFDHPYRFVIHDRDGIFSPSVDQELRGFGVRVLEDSRPSASGERVL